MTALNGRLKIMADIVKNGEAMADIGSDHGFLPLYLCENEICSKAVITDISAASLQKAKDAFTSYTGGAIVDFRVGDGLSALDAREVDIVVIAGVGGELITRILGEDVLKTLSFPRYILQPRNGSGKLRYWLEEAGFSILAENLAEEGKFICEIITAAPPRGIFQPPLLEGHSGAIEYEIPGKLSCDEKEMFSRFLNKKIGVEKNIIAAMTTGNVAAAGKVKMVERRRDFLEGLLKGVENDGF